MSNESPLSGNELRERLIELFDLVSQDRSTPEAERELSALLETNEGRREYLSIVHQEVLLENYDSVLSDDLSRDDLEVPVVSQQVVSASSNSNWTLMLGMLSLAVAMVVAVMILMKPAPQVVVVDDSPVNESVVQPSLVVMTQEAGAEFFAEHTPMAGSAMRMEHEYSLVTGQVELKFASGATAILEAPCMFEVASQDLLKLTYGNCSVHAPPGAEGFQVLTPAANVIDLGTRFHVQVTEFGDSNVQVIEGEAQVVPHDQSKSAEPVLTGGTAMRVGRREAKDEEEIAFDDSTYRRTLPDRVVGFTTSGPNRASQLETISVQRGGGVMRYRAGDLIGADVVSFCETGSEKLGNGNLLAPYGYQGDGHELALHDSSLVTGVVNPGGSRIPQASDPVLPGDGVDPSSLTPGMLFRFHKPIVNGPGPDLVVFDLQTTTNPPMGDAFHLLPAKFRDVLKPHTVGRYDIQMTSSAAHRVDEFLLLTNQFRPNLTLQDTFSHDLTRHYPGPRFWALAVGVDLSDLGFAAGESVQELFLQDAADDDDRIDPVFVGGFPAGEPVGLQL